MTESPIPIPPIETDEPVVVIPAASVAPLDGPPDGDRITTYMIAPKPRPDILGDLRTGVLAKPLTYVATAFAFGYMLSRLMR